MKKMSKIISLTFVVLLFSGCATIFKGTSASVRMNSTPSGAAVYVNNVNRGKTPLTLSLSRNNNYNLAFKMKGYQDVNMTINKKFDVATTIVGNIVSWGIIGIVVDIVDGSAYSLTPADINANMQGLAHAGYIPSHFNKKNKTLTVFMLTKQQWNAIKASHSGK